MTLDRSKPERNDKGQFVLGHNGGPGRPKGSRNQLGEALLADLYADWLEHGAEAIRQVREERPADYLKIVALIVSKCGDLNLDNELRDAAVATSASRRIGNPAANIGPQWNPSRSGATAALIQASQAARHGPEPLH
jgi:hypothetical protein